MKLSGRGFLTTIGILCAASLCGFLALNSLCANAVELSYDNTCPVIHTNDGNIDVYTQEYAMALASAGEINLVGIVADEGTGYGAKYKVKPKVWELGRRMYEDIAGKARRSGMVNIPDPVAGASWALDKPDSGEIEDTVPLDTPGSRLIVQEARKATPEKPLLVVTGGALTCAADAYLLDNTIADKLIVIALQGNANDMGGYNGAIDGWASYIVLQKFRYVQFVAREANPHVPKERLAGSEIPDSELKRFMVDKDQQGVNLPANKDADAPPMISVMCPDYPLVAKRVSFSHWKDIKDWWGNGLPQIPVFKGDPAGNDIVVTKSDRAVATAEWWRAMTNPAAYTGEVIQQSPFSGDPHAVPGIIQAEQFDWGGKGYAFHNAVPTAWPVYRVDVSLFNIEVCDDAGEGYNLKDFAPGDWYEYTVKVDSAGAYDLEARVASENDGAEFHIEFDGENKTGAVAVGAQNWETVTVKGIPLEAGEYVMRFVADSGKLKLNYVTVVMQRL